jgi:hypothetical protein
MPTLARAGSPAQTLRGSVTDAPLLGRIHLTPIIVPIRIAAARTIANGKHERSTHRTCSHLCAPSITKNTTQIGANLVAVWAQIPSIAGPLLLLMRSALTK